MNYVDNESAFTTVDLRAIARKYGGEFSGGQALIPTPGHSPKDRGTAIAAKPGDPTDVLVHCFNGGDPLAIKDMLRAEGLLPQREFKPRPQARSATFLETGRFEYVNGDGEVIYRTVRRELNEWRGPGKRHKEFRAQRYEGGRWIDGIKGLERVPYRLPELQQAIKAGETVFLVEGEAKADKLAKWGFTATAIAFGCNGWKAEHNYAAHFAGARLIILPDNDAPGRKFAKTVYGDLKGSATVSVLELTGLPPAGDIMDWQGSPDVLRALLDDAGLPDWLEADEAQADEGTVEATPGPILQDSAAFCRSREPADYLIDGSVRDGWLYPLTAPTGHGKSAVALAIAHAIAKGGFLGSREVKQGAVLFLAGENADDIRERWIATCERHGDDPASLPVTFMPGVWDLKSCLPMLRDRFKETPLRLVVVDTLAAFFPGDNENDNAQQQEFATQVLRPLTELPGRPAVLVPAHPTKGAGKDNLTPKGGSSLLNAVDGNLTAWNTDGTVKVHWQGKFRGAPWAPLYFELSEYRSAQLVDSKGRIMPTVTARAMLDSEIAQATERGVKIENQVLKLLADGKTVREIADDVHADGQRGVSKSRVDRMIQRLAEQKWITKNGRQWALTTQGWEVLKQAGEPVDPDA